MGLRLPASPHPRGSVLPVVDEYTRECLAIEVKRKLNSESVLEQLGELFVHRGLPAYIRSDNGPEFTAQAVRDWLSVWASARC